MFQGRVNRATYWLCVGVIVVLYAASNIYLERNVPVSEIVLVLLCVPRLHDIGRSGWLVVGPLVFEIGAVVAAFSLLPQQTALAVAGVATIIITALLVWLGCIPGDTAANRFGEPPAPGLTFKPTKTS